MAEQVELKDNRYRAYYNKFARVIQRDPKWISIGLVFILLVLLVVDGLSLSALGVIIKEAGPLALFALGVGFVIACGQIDVSIISISVLSSILYCLSSQFDNYIKWILLLSLLLLPFLHMICAGYLISYRKSPALITTWGLGIVYMTISQYICIFLFDSTLGINGYVGGQKIIGDTTGISLSTGASRFGFYDISSGGWSYLVFLLPIFATVHRSQLHRLACALGGSKKSSNYIGIDSKKMLSAAYLICALSSCLAGIVLALQTGKGALANGSGDELVAIAIAVLGGTVMSGGFFSAWGILAGAVAFAMIGHLTNSTFSFIPDAFQAKFVEVWFALVILFVGALFGRRMTGDTEVEVVKGETE